MTKKQIRTATVKKTGNRYIVQSIDFSLEKVFVWGELRSYRGTKATHYKSLRFRLEEVDIIEAERTSELLDELFEQSRREIKRSGYKVHDSTNTILHSFTDPNKVKAIAQELDIDLALATSEEYDAIVELIHNAK